MQQSLVEAVDVLHAALVSFQSETYSGEDCATLVEKLAALENVSAPPGWPPRSGLETAAPTGNEASPT